MKKKHRKNKIFNNETLSLIDAEIKRRYPNKKSILAELLSVEDIKKVWDAFPDKKAY